MDYKNKYLKYKLKYLAAKKQYTGGAEKNIINYKNQDTNDINEGTIDNNKHSNDKDFFKELFKKMQTIKEQKVEEEEWFFFNKPYPNIIFTEVDACSTSIIYGINKEGHEVMAAIHIRKDNNLAKLLEQMLDNFIDITKIYILTNSHNNNIYDLLNKLSLNFQIDLNGKIFILNIKTQFITPGMHFSHIGNTIKIIYTDKQIHIEGWTPIDSSGKRFTTEKFEKDDDTNFSPYIIYPHNDFEYRLFYYVLKTCKKLQHILELFKNNFCSILSKHKTNQYITYSPELCEKILKFYDNDSINDKDTCEDYPDNVKYWLGRFLIHHPNIIPIEVISWFGEVLIQNPNIMKQTI